MESLPVGPFPINDIPKSHAEGIWPNGPVQLARGRQAKDPNAKVVSFTVTSIEEFETSLREYLSNPPEQPDHTECQLSFWPGTSFVVSTPRPTQRSQQQSQHAQRPQHHPPQQSPVRAQHPRAPPGYQPANGIHSAQYGASSHLAHTYQSISDPAIALTLPNYASSNGSNGHVKDNEIKTTMSILEALDHTPDPKEKMRKQRAIAKCCIDSIQKVDGYRYSFHNCWNSREDDSFRFSYYCNDSLLNKDRAANGKGAKLGKRATKPVYDCKGVLSVKFSANKQSLDVIYKHVPVHKTYEERAPPPRKDSKRRKFLEENDPEALIRIANRPKPQKTPEEPERERSAESSKPKKKKTKPADEPKKATNSIESDLRAQSLRSLLELIQVDPAPQPAQEHSLPPPQSNDANEGPPVPPQQATQTPLQQASRRVRNSCDVCKSKKTRCDGARPVCTTCIEKNRQCVYSQASIEESRRSLTGAPQPIQNMSTTHHTQAVGEELSELEKMKKELEEAKARIHQLESEQSRTSSTSMQTPRIQPPQPLRQHHQQQSQQMSNVPQLQAPQFSHTNNHANHPSHNPYGLNRSMQFQAPNHPPHSSTTHQVHSSNAGTISGVPKSDMTVLSPASLTPTQDSNSAYNRDFWPATFYGYQAAQQQPQDQWGSGRAPGVFR